MKRGHSNVNAGETKPYSTEVQHVALVPLVGGASVGTVRELPPLALQRDEWLTIGRRMGWLNKNEVKP